MTHAGSLRPAIRKLVARADLSESEMTDAIELILTSNAQTSIAAFLVALAMKGESARELRSALTCIKAHATRITPRIKDTLIDTCGTGGDGVRTFNISTAAAILAASAGATVAKHGNRSSSGICGSADFMEYIGLTLDLSPSKVQESIEQIGFGFLFAPSFHPALRNVSAVRKELGIRTIFNLVGPLCNPCTNITGQMIGVYEPSLLETFSEVCQGYLRDALILHAHDGLDELSNTCANDLLRISEGKVQRLVVMPRSLGIKLAKLEQLTVATKEEAIRDTLLVLNGRSPPEKEDVVVMNAAAALTVARVSKGIKEGMDLARSALKSGACRKKLGEIIRKCGNPKKLEEAEKKFLGS